MYKKLQIGIFAFLLLFFPVATLVALPDKDNLFSENENRYLSGFPTFSFDRVLDRSFMKGFETWAGDMFIARENWIRIKNETELLLGKTEIDGVFINREMLIQKWRDYNKSSVDRNLAAMNDFAVRNSSVPVYFMLIPTAQEIYPGFVPQNAETKNQRNFIKYCYEQLSDINCIDVTPTLAEHGDNYIYYRTDHHWTSLGAYFGYSVSSQKMNFTPVDISDFNIEHASNSFMGTLFSKTLYFGTEPDTIDFYHISSGAPEVSVKIYGGENEIVNNSLYFREYLDKKDKYAAFLGANPPLTRIETSIEGNEKKLLVFKDSYANSLIPFYTNNYSEITVLDMRFINADYRSLVNVEDYDQILFVYNVITFSEDTNLIKLNMGRN